MCTQQQVSHLHSCHQGELLLQRRKHDVECELVNDFAEGEHLLFDVTGDRECVT